MARECTRRQRIRRIKEKRSDVMTFERFKEIDKRVLEAIGLTLDKVRLKSFSDFALLLASGDYYEVLYTHTNDMSPYVIEDPTDELIDDTRQSFLNSFLRKYINRIKDGVEMYDQELEYEINIQLMVYTHVWESHWFLKQLERIAAILTGKGYVWKSSVMTTPKSSFIREHIIQRLDGKSDLLDIIKRCYSDTLRNDFAHSSYYIDMGDRAIKSHKHGLLEENVITFSEWEKMFVNTILLSVDLNNMLFETKQNFVALFGDGPIVCKWPSRDNPPKKYDRAIRPMPDRANPEYIRFDFVR